MIKRIGFCGKSAVIPIVTHGKRSKNPNMKDATLIFLIVFSPFPSDPWFDFDPDWSGLPKVY
jgi:hypothetical protein